MRKMIIHCASGIRNSGDEAILHVLLNRYKKDFDITVISLDADYTMCMHPGVKAINNSDRKCLTAIKNCDIFILGGGGLLQDDTTIFNISRWLSKLRIAADNNKFIYVYANSIGNIKYSINKKLVKKYLASANIITVRDNISLQNLRNLGITQSILVTADPVFSFEPLTSYQIESTIEKYTLPNEYISISIRHWYDAHPFIPVSICTKLNIRSSKNKKLYNMYIVELSKTVNYITGTLNQNVVFTCFCYNRDYNVVRDVLKLINNQKNVYVINDEYLKPYEMMAIINRSKLLIGMRLHSIIYALTNGVPTIPIIYQDKVAGIVKMANLSDFQINIDQIDSSRLIKSVTKILSNRDEYQDQIIKTLADIRLQENRNIECLEANFSV